MNTYTREEIAALELNPPEEILAERASIEKRQRQYKALLDNLLGVLSPFKKALLNKWIARVNAFNDTQLVLEQLPIEFMRSCLYEFFNDYSSESDEWELARQLSGYFKNTIDDIFRGIQQDESDINSIRERLSNKIKAEAQSKIRAALVQLCADESYDMILDAAILVAIGNGADNVGPKVLAKLNQGMVPGLQNNRESLPGVINSTGAVASPGAAEPPAVDTTDDLKGTITASGENTPNEGKEKAFDNQADTKWLNFSAQSWIQYSYAAGIAGRLTGYTLTSGGDAPERDPADFLLAGSNDGGKSWTTVDTRTGVSFSARQQKQLFTLGTPATFKTYRLTVNRVANGSDGLIQISEIELLGQQVQSQ